MIILDNIKLIILVIKFYYFNNLNNNYNIFI